MGDQHQVPGAAGISTAESRAEEFAAPAAALARWAAIAGLSALAHLPAQPSSAA